MTLNKLNENYIDNIFKDLFITKNYATLKTNIKENKDKKTFRELSTEGLMIGAVQGKAENYKLIMQVLGEMQQEEATTPEVNINIVDQSTLEKSLYENNN